MPTGGASSSGSVRCLLRDPVQIHESAKGVRVADQVRGTPGSGSGLFGVARSNTSEKGLLQTFEYLAPWLGCLV